MPISLCSACRTCVGPGLLGPNGSGKTTAINCMLSLLKYDKGSVELFGEPMRPDAYEIKKQIGVVFQNIAVFEELSVEENVSYFCSLYVKDKAERERCVEWALDFVGLREFRGFRPRKLSGGMLRRLNIALIVSSLDEIKHISSSMEARGVLLTSVEFTESLNNEVVALSCVARLKNKMTHDEVIRMLYSLDGIIFAERLDL